ncbi:uncharacterized protein [Patagioenas fasciata]|uniref:uncharacterized protein isoform X2 n=1 Tax=Patagioenas fasciata TaxID=372321 RepID=UPI003A9924A7
MSDVRPSCPYPPPPSRRSAPQTETHRFIDISIYLQNAGEYNAGGRRRSRRRSPEKRHLWDLAFHLQEKWGGGSAQCPHVPTSVPTSVPNPSGVPMSPPMPSCPHQCPHVPNPTGIPMSCKMRGPPPKPTLSCVETCPSLSCRHLGGTALGMWDMMISTPQPLKKTLTSLRKRLLVIDSTFPGGVISGSERADMHQHGRGGSDVVHTSDPGEDRKPVTQQTPEQTVVQADLLGHRLGLHPLLGRDLPKTRLDRLWGDLSAVILLLLLLQLMGLHEFLSEDSEDEDGIGSYGKKTAGPRAVPHRGAQPQQCRHQEEGPGLLPKHGGPVENKEQLHCCVCSEEALAPL